MPARRPSEYSGVQNSTGSRTNSAKDGGRARMICICGWHWRLAEGLTRSILLICA